MSKSAENSCNSSFYNKIINETPILHTVPQLPLLMNAFSNNPNEITVFSSSNIKTLFFPLKTLFFPFKPYFSLQKPHFIL